MERKQGRDQEEYDYYNHSRATTFGHQTSEHKEICMIVNGLVEGGHISLAKLVEAYRMTPSIKEDPKLTEALFQQKRFAEELVRLVVSPMVVLEQHKLGFEQGRVYVSTVKDLLFENFDFYQYYFLGLQEGSLALEVWFQFLDDNKTPSFQGSLANLADVFLPFIKYQFSTSSRITDYFQQHHIQKPILLISYFNQLLIDKLLKFTHFEAVWKAFLSLIIVSLQEQEWKMSLIILKSLCLSALENNSTLDSHVEQLYGMVKEVSNNIEKDIHNTIFAFSDAYVQTNIVTCCLNRVRSLESKTSLTYEEELSLEFNFKTLSEILNTYYLLRKNGIDYKSGQMIKLMEQISQIYKAFESILKYLQGVKSKTSDFSNGENIRCISFYRLELLNLLRNGLQVIKEFDEGTETFKNFMDKSLILQLLTRCLSENRWNSITHNLIEKIICLMINTQFFKTRNNAIHQFLSFLVQAFSNKKYMFLSSTKMINQGDIHFLYIISRRITAELDRMPAIVDSTSEYDFWKGFVLNVLQNYENKSQRLSTTQVPEGEQDYFDRMDKNEDLSIEIDEVALIKEIVKKIEVNKKWNFHRKEHHSFFRIGSASQLNKTKSAKGIQKSGTPSSHSKPRSSTNEQQLKLVVKEVEKSFSSSSGFSNSKSHQTKVAFSKFCQIEDRISCLSDTEKQANEDKQENEKKFTVAQKQKK